jgi:polysaccharide export outer membrane protein
MRVTNVELLRFIRRNVVFMTALRHNDLRAAFAIFMAAVALAVLGGCASPKVSSPQEMAAFETAGPILPQVDAEQLVLAKRMSGEYHVVAGDVLAIQVPALAKAAADPDLSGSVETVSTRVDRQGKIALPVVGEIAAAGKTLTQIEDAVAELYFPKFLKRRPVIVAKVGDFQTIDVTVIGAVRNPGLYELKSNEHSLVAALMKAGGVIETGATAIRVRSAAEDGSQVVTLPVKGLNTPFADVAVKPGDTIEVERLEPQFITVLGLVNRPGAFPYQPGAKHTLGTALASAGGINDVADPKFVRVYRQAADGQLVYATFPINNELARSDESVNVQLKPGDVVAVEHTGATRMRTLVAQMVRFSTGVVYDLNQE